MRRFGIFRDKSVETIVGDILKSRARSRIYVYLLRKKSAMTEDIINGTKLHPSTVRETLSKMYHEKQIYRKKVKNCNIGKNPYIYYPISPIDLLKRYTTEIENRLNKLAGLASDNGIKNYRPIKINFQEKMN